MTRTRNIRFTALAAVLTVVAAALVLVGCSGIQSATSGSSTSPGAIGYPVTITDDSSHTVTISSPPKRIVSLAPANTEILFAIGAGDRVVGVTTYDDFPPQVKKLPKVGDFMNPNLEAIAAAKPDLIVATNGVQAETLKKLSALGATVISIDPQTVQGVMTDTQRLGEAVDETGNASSVVSGMQAAINNVKGAVSGSPRPTVFVEIGQNPLYTVGQGTLMGDLVALAGGTNVVTQSGYLPYSVEQLVKANPDYYLATKGSSSNPAAMSKRPGFAKLAAVSAGHVVILDDSLVSRPGPRIVLGLKAIARAIHPEAFPK